MPNVKKVGKISVDSGMIMLIDPCYVLHLPEGEREQNKDFGKNWLEFCDKTETLPKQFKHNNGNESLAVVLDTKYGDGTYNVFIEYDNEDRPSKIIIDLG